MIQTVRLVPVVKELVYHLYSEESDELQELKAVVKFQKVVLDALADLLEMKAENECNIYILQDLIKFYAVYAKSFNFMFDTIKLVECSNEEKEIILEMIKNMQDINDGDDIVDMLFKFIAKSESNPHGVIGGTPGNVVEIGELSGKSIERASSKVTKAAKGDNESEKIRPYKKKAAVKGKANGNKTVRKKTTKE